MVHVGFLDSCNPYSKAWSENQISPLKTKLLFICSRNLWRSPTAEALFKNHSRYTARSAGTTERARIKVTEGHIGWADMIFCMERKHTERLREQFAGEIGDKPVITLRIPDDFIFMDPELIGILQAKLREHLDF